MPAFAHVFIRTKFYGTELVQPSNIRWSRMSNNFNERSAGVWFALVFYVIGGVYMLAFWGVFDTAAYALAALGAISVVIGVALFMLSRWGFWIGLFTFPLYLVEFIYATVSSVNLVGWFPDAVTGIFQSSMIIYLVFLCFSFILLLDRRNSLKNDRILDSLSRVITASRSEK